MEQQRQYNPPNNDAPPVAVKDLRKSFGKQKVLDGIELTIERGSTIAILGRSGTGKSVFLKLLIGLQKADSGSICVTGKEVTEAGRTELNEIRKKVGFLFQQAALYDSLTVEENVAFPISRHSEMSDEERRSRVKELLARMGMEKDLNKMPADLSGGMKKRVGLARALALDPEILLFDEPTAGLDPVTGSEIANLIAEQGKDRQRTSIVVTHDLRAAKSFAERVVMIHEGRVLVDGTFEDLENSDDEFVSRYWREATQ
jgi:phospholipid/cholesterol/gamma-HCH transport system ATP-binding protein